MNRNRALSHGVRPQHKPTRSSRQERPPRPTRAARPVRVLHHQSSWIKDTPISLKPYQECRPCPANAVHAPAKRSMIRFNSPYSAAFRSRRQGPPRPFLKNTRPRESVSVTSCIVRVRSWCNIQIAGQDPGLQPFRQMCSRNPSGASTISDGSTSCWYGFPKGGSSSRLPIECQFQQFPRPPAALYSNLTRKYRTGQKNRSQRTYRANMTQNPPLQKGKRSNRPPLGRWKVALTGRTPSSPIRSECTPPGSPWPTSQTPARSSTPGTRPRQVARSRPRSPDPSWRIAPLTHSPAPMDLRPAGPHSSDFQDCSIGSPRKTAPSFPTRLLCPLDERSPLPGRWNRDHGDGTFTPTLQIGAIG